jgi:hypothetical protein
MLGFWQVLFWFCWFDGFSPCLLLLLAVLDIWSLVTRSDKVLVVYVVILSLGSLQFAILFCCRLCFALLFPACLSSLGVCFWELIPLFTLLLLVGLVSSAVRPVFLVQSYISACCCDVLFLPVLLAWVAGASGTSCRLFCQGLLFALLLLL